jgi:hypothetical protein
MATSMYNPFHVVLKLFLPSFEAILNLRKKQLWCDEIQAFIHDFLKSLLLPFSSHRIKKGNTNLFLTMK